MASADLSCKKATRPRGSPWVGGSLWQMGGNLDETGVQSWGRTGSVFAGDSESV